MSKQKTAIHDIDFNTQHLCLDTFDSDITQYEGFNEQNSPWYGGVLNNWYSKKVTDAGNNIFVDTKGNIWSTEPNSNYIYKNGSPTVYLDKPRYDMMQLPDTVVIDNKEYEIKGAIDTDNWIVYRYDNTSVLNPIVYNFYIYYAPSKTLQGGVSLTSIDTVEGYFDIIYTKDDKYVCTLGNDIFIVHRGTNNKYRIDHVVDIGSTLNPSGSIAHFDVKPVTTSFCGSALGVRININSTEEVPYCIAYFTDGYNCGAALINMNDHSYTFPKIYLEGIEITDKYGWFISDGWIYTAKGYGSAQNIKHHAGEVSGGINATRPIPDNLNFSTVESVNYGGQEVCSDIYTGNFTEREVQDVRITCSSLGACMTFKKQVKNSEQYIGSTGTIYPGWGEYLTTWSFHESETGIFIPMVAFTGISSLSIPTMKSSDGTVLDRARVASFCNVGMDSNGNIGNISLKGTVFNKLFVSTPDGYAMTAVANDAMLLATDVSWSAGNFIVDENKNKYILYTVNPYDVSFKVLENRYLLINDGTLYDTDTGATTTINIPFNGELVVYTDNYTEGADTTWYQAMAGNSQLQGPSISYISPQRVITLTTDQANNIKIFPQSDAKYVIDVFAGTVASGGNEYQYTFTSGPYIKGTPELSQLSIEVLNAKRGTNYIDDTIIPITPFEHFVQGTLNNILVQVGTNSYQLIYNNGKDLIFGYRIDQQQEGIDNLFVLQGSQYAILGKKIYAYDTNGTITPIVNIGELTFIGYTLYMALFFSETNKTLYSFTGDNILRVFAQSNSIGKIQAEAYNINTGDIFFADEEAVYILSQSQMMRLYIPNVINFFFTDHDLAFVTTDNTVYFYAYNPIEGYDRQDIQIKTFFYGRGNSEKSINDTVYFRFFDPEHTAGTVLLKATTLNETSFNTDEVEFEITKDMWDDGTDTCFLRYQPRYQEGTGFMLHITSPFAIATMQVSETGEATQNSTYNV